MPVCPVPSQVRGWGGLFPYLPNRGAGSLEPLPHPGLVSIRMTLLWVTNIATIGKWLSLGFRTGLSASISITVSRSSISVARESVSPEHQQRHYLLWHTELTEQVCESVSAKDSHELGERAEKTSLSYVARHPNRNRDGEKAKSSLSPNLVLVLRQLHPHKARNLN